MIRYLYLNAFIALWSIFMCFWGFAVSLFDKNGKKVHFLCAVPWARAILWVCGIKVHVTGVEDVDPDVPRIYMTNHQSFFDIFALLAYLPVDFKFILKQELMKIPLFGPAMRRAGYIGIERDDPRKAVQSMKQAAGRIHNGASVLIFPEGTRSPDGQLQAFKKGGFNLAVKAGCDIVPIGIRDSYRIAPKGSLRIQKGGFGLNIGKPVSLSGVSKRDIPELMEKVRSEMTQQMAQGDTDTRTTRGLTVRTHPTLVWLMACLFWAMSGNAAGYVIPIELLIDKMQDRFSSFHTLIVDQTTQILGSPEGEVADVFQEKVWLRAPGYYRSEIMGRSRAEKVSQPSPTGGKEGSDKETVDAAVFRKPNRDTTFRRLLMTGKRADILASLAQAGVDIDSIGVSRVDGTVVYRIGKKGPNQPRLLVDRTTFFPLLFSYLSSGSPQKHLVTVRFDHYKEVGSGWYPYAIDYTDNGANAERCFVLNIRVNPPIDISFFEAPARDHGRPPSASTTIDPKEEDRLKEAIQAIKEKYGE